MSPSSFAAAQQRILERQAQRQLDAQRQRAGFDEQVRDSALSRLPRPLNLTASPLTSIWNTLIDGQGTRPAFRVGQVDAELLDEELLTLLRGQVADGLKYFGPHLQDDWSREIVLALRAVLFKLSVWDNDASYGASLQNLRFADARQDLAAQARPTRGQKALYGLVTVLGRYGWERWEGWLVDQEAGWAATPSETVQRLGRLTRWLSTTHSIAALASFLVFLVNGRYRTLVDRVLRMRLVSPSNQISREVSFEYLNRQLVWHAFTEFLLFVLPLVGIGRWRRWLSRAWKKTKSLMQAPDGDGSGNGDDAAAAAAAAATIKSGPLAFLPERTCAICYQDQNPGASSESEILGANTGGGSGGIIGSATTDIVNPYETLPCNCVYCFVCLATKVEAEEGHGWTCLRCGETVYRCKPWAGDVVEDARKWQSRSPRIAKSVGFSDQQPDAGSPDLSDGSAAAAGDEADDDDDDDGSSMNKGHASNQQTQSISSSPDESQWSLADPDEAPRTT